MPEQSLSLPTAADVEAAAKKLEGIVLRTPLVRSPDDRRNDRGTCLKTETLQHTGSFKFRGAYNKISSILQEQRAAGVVAFSSGNHAQGVAAAAQMLGIRATIVMPKDAPKPKRDRTAAFAEVVLYDRDKGEDREVIARAIATERVRCWCRPTTIPSSSQGRAPPGARSWKTRRHRAEAGCGGGAEFRRGADCRRCAGCEGKGAASRSIPPSLPFRRLRAFAPQRQARAKPVAVGHHLRRAGPARRGNHFRR